MINIEVILSAADAFTERVKQTNQASDSDTRNLMIGATVVLVIGVVIFAVTYFRSRKKSNDQDQERLSQFAKTISPPAGSSSAVNKRSSKHRRRKRRRVREHRPRNPTLDKTGGLPPPRPDDQLPKY